MRSVGAVLRADVSLAPHGCPTPQGMDCRAEEAAEQAPITAEQLAPSKRLATPADVSHADLGCRAPQPAQQPAIPSAQRCLAEGA